MLEDAGAQVLAVADVESALAHLDRFGPSVVISDIGLPQQDGYDLIRRIRDRGHTADTLPAIALTAFARDDERARALSAGYQMHLSKPAAPAQLLTVVVALVQRARRHAGRP